MQSTDYTATTQISSTPVVPAGFLGGVYKQIPISRLVPNPFRNLEEYPIQREKVDLLCDSYRSTGFWGNIVARKQGDVYEIAYGHHRLVALQETYGKRQKVDVIVRKLTNEHMLQMMAAENMEEYGTSAWVELETIRAVIQAYGDGEIELPEVPKGTNSSKVRYAPNGSLEHAYTKSTVAQFLGWTSANSRTSTLQSNEACNVAFALLDAINCGAMTNAQIKSLTRNQAKVMALSVMRVKRSHEAKARNRDKVAKEAAKLADQTKDSRKRSKLKRQAEVLKAEAEAARKEAKSAPKKAATAATKKLKEGGIGVRDIGGEVTKFAATPTPKTYDIKGLANRIMVACAKVLTGQKGEELKALGKFKGELNDDMKTELIEVLRSLRRRIDKSLALFEE